MQLRLREQAGNWRAPEFGFSTASATSEMRKQWKTYSRPQRSALKRDSCRRAYARRYRYRNLENALARCAAAENDEAGNGCCCSDQRARPAQEQHRRRIDFDADCRRSVKNLTLWNPGLSHP